MGAAMSSCWPSMEENERKLLEKKSYSLSSSGVGTDEFPPSPVSRRKQRNVIPEATQFVEKKKKNRKPSRILSDLRKNEAKKPSAEAQDAGEAKVRRRKKDPCEMSSRTVDSMSTMAEIVDTKNLDRIFDCMQIEERCLWAQYGSDVFTPVTSDFNEWGALLPPSSPTSQ